MVKLAYRRISSRLAISSPDEFLVIIKNIFVNVSCVNRQWTSVVLELVMFV